MFQRPTPKELALRTLQANQAHQYALAQHAEKLTAQLAELDKLLAQADTEEGEDDIECDFYIPNAKPPVGPIRNFSNPESPFFEDAMKRNRYLNFTVRHTRPSKEIDVLKAAVNAELRRVEQLEGASSTTTDLQMVDKLNWTIIAEKVSDSSSVTRTAEECKIKWIGDLSPTTNRGAWLPPEVQKLQNIIMKKPSQTNIDWVEVARELGTNRLPLDCMRQSIERPRFVWNAEADQKLMDAVKQYGLAWSLVARYVSPNITANQCSTRYLRTLDPTLRRGAWTPEEDERLTAAIAGYGEKAAWAEIANAIPGRTNEQCRERWQLVLDPSKNTKKSADWDEEKNKALIEAVNTNGRKWKAIGVQLGRPAASCRLQYEALVKQDLISNYESPVTGPSTLPGTPGDDDETGTPSASARSTPRARTQKAQSQAVFDPPPAVAKPARPRPRALAKNSASGRSAALDPEDTTASNNSVVPIPKDAAGKNSARRGRKRAAPEPEDAPPQKKQAVQVKAVLDPQEAIQNQNPPPVKGLTSLSTTDLGVQILQERPPDSPLTTPPTTPHDVISPFEPMNIGDNTQSVATETSPSATPKKGRRRVPEVSSLSRRRSARLNTGGDGGGI
ncbi:Myb domain protein 4r1 [Mycena venus]|uniref:Myb domain protein 4r1 n=1 Tax=Mycena venus TaxID=2733690 RepID=A0A8H6Y5X7_9AGAR|nr:Myb domain protein 4r1 [Mycena venus]